MTDTDTTRRRWLSVHREQVAAAIDAKDQDQERREREERERRRASDRARACWAATGLLVIVGLVVSIGEWADWFTLPKFVDWWIFIGVTVLAIVSSAVTRMAAEAQARVARERNLRQAEANGLAMNLAFTDLAGEVEKVRREFRDAIGSMSAEIKALVDLQRDLERDLATLVISRQSDSPTNGHGSVINLRHLRPDGAT